MSMSSTWKTNEGCRGRQERILAMDAIGPVEVAVQEETRQLTESLQQKHHKLVTLLPPPLTCFMSWDANKAHLTPSTAKLRAAGQT